LKIFKNKRFARFARQEDITDRDLCEAIDRAERGLIDAPLGGGLIKQRIARPNEGKSGGFRSIIAFRSGERAFFAYGFPKNQRDNINDAELKALKELAQQYFGLTDEQIEAATQAEVLTEVKCDDLQK